MAFSERINLIIDVTTANGKKALDDIKKSMVEAKTPLESLKAGFKGTVDFVSKQPAILAAGAAAGAGVIAQFAAKSIGAFEDTALAAGKFADSTGLSVDSASRYIAVADDIGVSADTIQSAFIKMEKQLSTNGDAFKAFTAKAKDGSTDLDQTFLNVITHIQSIKNPIDRAGESAKFFGKGFAEVSQIIGTSADDLKKKLDSVSDAQVINADELAKARDYQAAMDNLGDSVGDLEREFGQALAPSIAKAANSLAQFINLTDSITSPLGGLAGTLDKLIKNAPIFGNALSFSSIFEKDASGIDRFGGAVGTIIPVLGNAIKLIDDGKVSAEAFAGAANKALEGIQAGTVDAGGWGQAFSDALTEAAKHAKPGMFSHVFDGLKESADDVDSSARAAADGLKAMEDATTGVHDAQLAALDTTFAQHKAQQDYVKATEDLVAVKKDEKSTTLDVQVATDDATDAAIKLAAQNQEIAKSSGAADGGQQAFIDTLKYLSGTASPEVKAQLDGIIGKLEAVGQQHPTPTVDVIDQATGKVRSASEVLQLFAQTKSLAEIGVDDQATAKIREAIRLGQLFAGSTYTADVTARTTRSPRAAGGAAQGRTLVGEDGAEVIDLPVGSWVHPNGASERMMRSGAQVVNYWNVTQNLPVGTDPSAVQAAIDRYRLRNGSR